MFQSARLPLYKEKGRREYIDDQRGHPKFLTLTDIVNSLVFPFGHIRWAKIEEEPVGFNLSLHHYSESLSTPGGYR